MILTPGCFMAAVKNPRSARGRAFRMKIKVF